MSEQLTLIPSQKKSRSALLDSLAKICLLLESEEVSQLHEAAYSLTQCESLGLKDPNISSLRTSKVFSQVGGGEILPLSSKRSPTLGMMVSGNYLIHGGFSPKIGSEYTLSDILEENVDQKYFLSEKMVDGLLNKENDFNGEFEPVERERES